MINRISILISVAVIQSCSSINSANNKGTTVSASENNGVAATQRIRDAIIGEWYADSAHYVYRPDGTVKRSASDIDPFFKWSVEGSKFYIDGVEHRIVLLTEKEFFFDYPQGGRSHLLKSLNQWNDYDEYGIHKVTGLSIGTGY